jgi:hypothetical protein
VNGHDAEGSRPKACTDKLRYQVCEAQFGLSCLRLKLCFRSEVVDWIVGADRKRGAGRRQVEAGEHGRHHIEAAGLEANATKTPSTFSGLSWSFIKRPIQKATRCSAEPGRMSSVNL